jgi:hypothetical protein
LHYVAGALAVGVEEKIKTIGGFVVVCGIVILLMGMQFGNFIGRWNISLGVWFLAVGFLVIAIGVLTVQAAQDIGKKL